MFELFRDLWPILAALMLVAIVLPWLEQAAAQLWRWTQKPANGEVVHSHQRTYQVVSEWSAGDACDVLLATHGRKRYLLKCPRNPASSELVVHERDVLRSLTSGPGTEVYRSYLPQLVESFHSGGNRINAFAFRSGLYTAEEIRLSHPRGLDARHLGWMLNRTLEVLGYVHRHGWLHGAVLPPHLLFDVANHGLVLVDWIHARRIGEPLSIVPERFKSWYPPECHRREETTEATDIFLAARSLIDLAGGDPLKGTLPPHIPHEMAEFLGRCLHPSPHLRPRDAWRLRDEWGELLRRLHGPPQFHVLAMHR